MTRLRSCVVSVLVLLALAAPVSPSANAGPTITEFQLRPRQNSSPIGITAGPDGNVWFTTGPANQIGRITTDGEPTLFPDPGGGRPWGITTGPDGNLWYTDLLRNRDPCCTNIGRLHPPPRGEITEFAFEAGNSPRPEEITAAPDGNLWFTLDKRIGRVTPDGLFTFFKAPSGGGITVGPDGNLWYTAGASIVRITLSGEVTSFPLAGTATDIVTGPDRNLWFTQFSDDAIGRMTPTGDVTIFDLPALGSGPYGITVGPDGNLWFTEYLANQIGQITTTGDIVEYPIPTPNAGPFHITSGPDGNLWFTEKDVNMIGRVSL